MSAALYPNPNDGALVNLNLTDLTSGQIQIRIIDALGRVVHTRSFSTEGSLNTILIIRPTTGSRNLLCRISIEWRIAFRTDDCGLDRRLF
jgi:hypothetical protein